MIKKIFIITASALIITIITAAAANYFSGTGSLSKQWKMEKKVPDNRTRPFSVPILLYHNIDGKGPFSVSLENIRTHFKMFREKKIRVIPLKELIEAIESGRPTGDRSIAITFDDGYKSMHTLLLPLVKEFGYPVTLFVYTDFIGRGRLTWDKLKELDRAGIDIQSHTNSHPDLTGRKAANDKNLFFHEIYMSKRLLELKLDKKIEFFAYPYGRYDLATIEQVKNSGYSRSFSTDYGSNLITRDNFCLRRHHIKSDYSLELIEKLID
jgi:peptidoglycan/xylan/chitin deacetylase (PgdA/CDA1 family)